MLDTPPPLIPNPQLAQQPVAKLLNHFTTALSSWLSDSYGLVQTGIVNDGKSKIPQLYSQDGSLYSIDLYPDDRMKALSFFERNGPSEIVWNDPLCKSGEWQHQLAAVVWVNLPLIDPSRAYDFTEEVALDFLTRGLLASPDGVAGMLAPGEIEQRQERVFSRYTNWPARQQLLMWPFSGFRIPFVVKQKYVACGLPFTPASPLPPVPPTLAPSFVPVMMNIPIGTVIGLTEATGAVLYDASQPDDEQALYGIAMTSAPAGQQVKVFQTPGGVLTIPNWGLIAGQTYFAGPNGTLVTSDAGLYFSQILGRAITADSLLYQPEDITILLQ